MFTLLIDTYHRIFHLLSNLKYLDLDVYSNYVFPTSLLRDRPSMTCSSSTITYLHVTLHNIDDCLHLLDGRLNRLHSFLVKLDFIHDPALLRRSALRITQYSFELFKNTVKIDRKEPLFFSHLLTYFVVKSINNVIVLVNIFYVSLFRKI
jgi:hypothetical protein